MRLNPVVLYAFTYTDYLHIEISLITMICQPSMRNSLNYKLRINFYVNNFIWYLYFVALHADLVSVLENLPLKNY